jgi:hypothetical protein
MNVADTKKALLTAARAYERATRAKTCGIATTYLRFGQKWEQRAREAMREIIPTKLEYRHWSPERKELFELVGHLPNAEYNAHLHRLEKCSVTEMEHMRRAAEERARSEGAADRSRARYERKRPKVRR